MICLRLYLFYWLTVMHKLYKDYNKVVSMVEQEFDRNIRLYGEQMQCGRGCSACCSQVFRITLMDAVVISDAMKRMTPEVRTRIQQRARVYLEERARMIEARAHGNHVDDEREVPTAGLRLPCPALEDGACQIYDARPVVCRKWGIPLFDPQHPDSLQACELNFPPGTAIEDNELDELIDRQTEISEYWQDLKAAVNARNHTDRKATTIAEAILGENEEMLK